MYSATKTFFFVFVFVFSLKYCLGWSLGEDVTCAFIYSNEVFVGDPTPMKHGSQISEAIINETTTLGISSFKINPGCRLNVCAGAYLTGECNQYERDTPSLSNEWGAPHSVACSCSKECKCEAIILRPRECARAYVDSGCQDCNSMYTSLRKGTGEQFPQIFSTKVKSVVVKGGCTLKIFNEIPPTNAAGYELQQGEIIQNWDGSISSYDCTCDKLLERKYARAHPTILPDDFPPLLDVPKKASSINLMLNYKYKNHPGLVAALQSMGNKRSPTNAYILLVGLTGAGKSTTINLLFDNSTITRVGDTRSTTTDINEYRIPVSVPEFGIKNSELRVIDTPGMVDTRGLEQDSRYLATLNDYLEKHEDLKRSIPNIVLVFAKYSDNRFQGEGSQFVKMLRTIDLFRDRLMDKKYSNVILVLTHFMSETNENTRKPSERLDAIRRVVNEYSLFPKPIVVVVAENKPEAAHLPTVNGYHKLPNGEFYPRNLFDKMEQALYSAGDPIGEAIIRTAFKNPDNLKVTQKKFPLVPSSHSKVIHYMGVLSSFDRATNSTDITALLTSAHENLPDDVKKAYPGALEYLKRSLSNRNIQNIEDIPRSADNILKFFSDIHKNPATLFLLDKALNLTAPLLNSNNKILVGYGYDVIHDRPLYTTPFDFSEVATSDIGLQIPVSVNCDVKNQMVDVFRSCLNTEDYVQQRLELLKLDEDENLLSKDHILQGDLKPGFNIEREHTNTLNTLLEQQLFLLTLKNKNLKFNSDFLGFLGNLPDFNETNWDSVEAWRQFFTTYGTHIVQSAYGGASIEISVQVDNYKRRNPTLAPPTTDLPQQTTDEVELVEKVNDSYENVEDILQNEQTIEFPIISNNEFPTNNLFDVREKLTDGMSKIVDFLANSFINRKVSSELNEVNYVLKYKGGDHKCFVSNLSDPDSFQKLANWRNSLMFNPVMLETDLTLLPISELVKTINETVAQQLNIAAGALFNASLNYRPSHRGESVGSGPAGRERIDSQGITGDYTIVREFSNVFQMMAEQARAASEKFMQMMLQQQENSKQAFEEAERERMERREAQLRRMDQEIAQKKLEEREEEELLQLEYAREAEQMKIQEENRAAQERYLHEVRLQERQQEDNQFQQYLQFISQQNEIAAQREANRKPWYSYVLQAVPAVISGGLALLGG